MEVLQGVPTGNEIELRAIYTSELQTSTHWKETLEWFKKEIRTYNFDPPRLKFRGHCCWGIEKEIAKGGIIIRIESLKWYGIETLSLYKFLINMWQVNTTNVN